MEFYRAVQTTRSGLALSEGGMEPLTIVVSPHSRVGHWQNPPIAAISASPRPYHQVDVKKGVPNGPIARRGKNRRYPAHTLCPARQDQIQDFGAPVETGKE